MSASGPAEQFYSSEQQRTAAEAGLWVFLGSEMLFFGGILLALAIYRWLYFDAFAEGTRHLNLSLGTLNTGILLTSSFCMAMAALRSGSGGEKKWIRVTILLGLVFLAVKGLEYRQEYREQLIPAWNLSSERFSSRFTVLFFLLYFLLTGLHALHLFIGLCLLVPLGWGRKQNLNRIEMVGLYWHFVDIVWVFLYPALYLIGRTG